ncbi:hypothetical protein O0I10_004741 [Lichtheimia ornata]|uniref:ACB domain-containing protein n=1 Tax=Lichtheimia ornata TaxID=688661 RepID=A0AAD7V4W8_9FUNG|nr:uncharacterized protein O0I10_004741 [Lichtheimia ornata]KAJ8659379.1 hypothetical protein O0I10_004741 [Lichtheimia ornata]
MSTIPSHYSKAFVHQRFRKALSIVQHYSSSLEPSKDQRLELYALFKQASTGNVNTQRPGIFDVVGRAKWDAWKQLEGLSTLEAKHRYVEAFLRVASEAYRKPSSRAQAQQILQAFATMQPSSIQEESSDDDEDDDEYEDDEESSVIAEERAYLRDIQQQQRQYYQRRQSSLRPPSAASTQISAITAPSTPLGRPNSAISNRIRRPPVLLQGGDDDSVILDPNVNPWVSSSTKDIDPRQQQQQQQRRDSLLTPSFDPTSPLEHRPESFNRLVSSSSPSYPTAPSSFVSNPSSPARSNITATQEQDQQGTHPTNTSVVSLGPATRRALETLETEIIALNERIDGLKQELRANITNTAPSSSSTAPRKKKRAGQWPWRWIVKMALRHTIVHILLLVCFALYMDQSPIALITQIVASQRNRQRAIV